MRLAPPGLCRGPRRVRPETPGDKFRWQGAAGAESRPPKRHCQGVMIDMSIEKLH